MPSPFPGMDPYLEAQNLWPDFHNALATEIRNELNRLLPRPYYALMEARPELGNVEADEPRPRLIVPDVAVARGTRWDEAGGGVAVLAEVAVGRAVSRRYEIRVDTEPYRHPFIEIRDASKGHRLVTLIEFLSPSNKRPGADRRAYEFKQREVLGSDASLIEVDLLRGGDRVAPPLVFSLLLAAIEPPSDYLVLVSVSWDRDASTQGYIAYPAGLREPLPCIEVPLKMGEAQPRLDLQKAFDRAYDGGPYSRGAVDYRGVPEPPLGEGDLGWVRKLIGPV